MYDQVELQLKRKIRSLIVIFIIFLALSGITAFPIETELRLLYNHKDALPHVFQPWLEIVCYAVFVTNQKYPFLAYGTDWLAFAHLVIAVAFFGPLKNPVRNIWVIEFGMIACGMVLPLALIAGAVRHIPFYWRLIDCSFGVLGIIPLYFCYRLIKRLERRRSLNVSTV